MAALLYDTFTGSDGSAPDAQWTDPVQSGGTATIQSNELRLRCTGVDSFYYLGTDVAETEADVDVVVKARCGDASGTDQAVGPGVRVSPTGSDGLFAVVFPSGAIQLVEFDGFSPTVLDQDLSAVVDADTDWWVRLQASGTTVRARLWQDGDPEPDTWTVSGTTSITAAGGVTLDHDNTGGGTRDAFFDDCAVFDSDGRVLVEGFDWATSGADDEYTLIDEVNVSSAFVRVTSAGTRSGGSGPTGSTGNQGPNNMLAVELVDMATLVARRSSTTVEQKVFGEVWRYEGPAGGPNEFKSRGLYAVSLGTATSATQTVAGLADRNKAVPILVGVTTAESSVNDFNRAVVDVYLDSAGDIVVQRGEGGSALTAYVHVVEFVGSAWSVGHGVSTAHDSVVETVTLNTDSRGTGGSTFDVGDWSTALIVAATMEGDTSETGLADTLANLEPGSLTTTVDFDIDTADGGAANDGEAHFHVIQHDDLSVFREVIASISEVDGGVNGSIGFPSGAPTDRNLNQLSVGEWYVSTSGTGTAHMRGALGAVVTAASGTVEHWVHRQGNNVRVTWALADLSAVDTSTGPQTYNENALAVTATATVTVTDTLDGPTTYDETGLAVTATATVAVSDTLVPASGGGATIFEDDFTGTNGDPWDTGLWPIQDEGGGSSAIDIQTNRGRIYAANSFAGGGIAISSITGHDNLTITGTFEFVGVSGHAFMRWYVRATFDVGNNIDDGYAFQINNRGSVNSAELERWDAGSDTTLDSIAEWPTDSILYQWKIELDGTTLRMRWWEDGDTEPGTWQLEATDATYGSGGVGVELLRGSGENTIYLDDFTAVDPDASAGTTYDETGLAVTATASLSVVDTADVAEAAAVTVTSTLTASDTADVAEAVAVTVTSTVTAVDAATVAEAVAVAVTATVTAVDSTVASEALAVAAAVTVAVVDETVLQEAAGFTVTSTLTPTDVLTAVDAVGFTAVATLTASDASAAVEDLTLAAAATLTGVATLTAVDAAGFTIVSALDVTDTLDTAATYDETGRTFTIVSTVAGTDLLVAAEPGALTATATVTVSDTADLQDVNGFTIVSTVDVTDTLDAAATYDETGRTFTIVATITATDVITGSEPLQVAATAALTAVDAVSGVEATAIAATVETAVEAILVAVDSVGFTINATITGTDSLDAPSVFDETGRQIDGTVTVTVVDTVDAADLLTVDVDATVTAVDGLVYVEAAQVDAAVTLTVVDPAVWTDPAAVTGNVSLVAADTAVLVDAAAVDAAVTLTVVDSLAVTGAAPGSWTGNRPGYTTNRPASTSARPAFGRGSWWVADPPDR